MTQGWPRLDISLIREKLSEMNILLLSTAYQNNRQLLDLQCGVCGHQWQAKWGHLADKHGCPECANERKGAYHKLTMADVEVSIQGRSIRLLETEYQNCDTPIQVECLVCGFRWAVSAYRLIRGSGCPSCAHRGENNAAWRGGWRKQDYVGFTENVRASVLDRDHHTCQYPECMEVSSDKNLDVHHIDGDKKNYSENNLISLCHAHHSKVEQNNPAIWINYFRSLVRYEVAC